MSEIFLNILNMSISSSVLIIAVLLIRYLFKRMPKSYMCILWAMVVIKLIFPFSVESKIALSPSKNTIPTATVISGESFYISSGYKIVDNTVNQMLSESTNAVSNSFEIFDMISVIWFIGVIIMMIYFALSFTVVKLKISDAVLLKENIYQSEKVKSPFVLGLIKPKIFIPYNLKEDEKELILDHEMMHIKRLDHLSKPFSYIILAIHFFNPFIWIAYYTYCKDVELACDESVIRNYDSEKCKKYAYALLNSSVKGINMAVSPLGFGEANIKERVKNTVSYRKPTLMGVISIILLCVICAGCFMTEPMKEKAEDFFGYAYSTEEKVYDSKNLAGKDNLEFVFSKKKMLFKKTDELMASQIGQWIKTGDFEKINADKNFEKLFFSQGKWKDGYSLDAVKENSIVYKAIDKSINTQYFLIASGNGDIYFGTGFYDIEGETDPYSDDSDIKKLYKMQKGDEEPENVGYVKTVRSSPMLVDVMRKAYEALPEGYEIESGGGSAKIGEAQTKSSNKKDELCELTTYTLYSMVAVKKENGKTVDKVNIAIPMKFVYSVSVYGEYTLISYDQANSFEEIEEKFPKECIEMVEDQIRGSRDVKFADDLK